MKIVVTGSQGFLGSWLTRDLTARGHDVVGCDIRIDPLTHDLRDPATIERFIADHQPDIVVHLAARVGRLFGEDNPAETVTDNAAMTATIAAACGQHNVRLAYASTSEIYGDQGDTVCDEHDGPFGLPHNIYGLSKRWGEDACRLYAPDRLTIFRFSMPYGPGLPAGYGRAALINFLANALHRRPLTVHRGAERSWCWVGDTIAATVLALEHEAGGVWNVGRDDNTLPMLEVARMACDLVGANGNLIQEIDPPARQTVVKRLATRRIRDELGWQPTVTLEEGMRRTLDWLDRQPA